MVSEPVALSRAASARTCPINVLPGWVHNDGDTERIPLDASLDFNPDDDPYLRPATATRALPTLPVGLDDVGLVSSKVHGDDAYSREEPARVPPVTTVPAGNGSSDGLPSPQSFLEQTGVIPAGETFSSAAELRAYVRGRIIRL